MSVNADKDIISHLLGNKMRVLQKISPNSYYTIVAETTFPKVGGKKKTQTPKKTTTKSTKTPKLHEGPKGGKYYIKSGKKVYVK